MKEEIKAGGKEFAITLFWSAVLYLFCGMMMSLFSDYAFIGGVISILIFCVFGFFVLTRYTARFTYNLNDNRLRINRMIGKRNKEVDIAIVSVIDTAYGIKPADFPKKPYMMRVSIASSKRSMFIKYKNKDGEIKGVVIEPSQKLKKRIDLERKKVDND